MRYVLLTLLTSCLAIAIAQAANDEIYRWVDNDGVVHFGKRPPQETQAELVDIDAAPAATTPDISDAAADAASDTPANPAAEAAAEPTVEPELSYAEQRRQERDTRRKEAAEEKKLRDINCVKMNQVVATLEPSPHVIVSQEDGSSRRLDDKERLEALTEAKDYLAENCD